VIRSGFPGDVPAPWWGAIRYGLVAATLAFLWVALVQEPVWLARRLGFIRRSPEWQYDVILTGLIDDFNEKIAAATTLDITSRRNMARPSTGERDALRNEAERILTRLRSTPAPTDTWAALAAEYANLLALHIEHLGEPISLQLERHLLDLNANATSHREGLRADYRSKARSMFRWP
jgi:hypothetical protein